MLHFAVAGAPLKTPKPGGTCKGLEYAHSLGITAMEMEWVQTVPKSIERMAEIRACAEKLNMVLTVHAPYYINLNSEKPETIEASIKRILDALHMGELAGARSVCVHAAFNRKMDPDAVYDNVAGCVERIMNKKDELFPHVNLGLETMGKHSQFGTLEEVLRISKEFDLYPVVDPAHMHARTNGQINTTQEWNDMFDLYEKCLGKKSLGNVHMHFSGIEYTAAGERKHLPLQESDARWEDFIRVLKDRKIGGVVVCESPILEDDTLLMKETYESLA